MRVQGAVLGAVLSMLAMQVACGETATQDTLYPSCNDAPSDGLATEATSGGQCPAHPTTLIGTLTVGSPCTEAGDCKPYCCQCSNGQGALVAQCAHGSCLDGSDTCCLYAEQCGN